MKKYFDYSGESGHGGCCSEDQYEVICGGYFGTDVSIQIISIIESEITLHEAFRVYTVFIRGFEACGSETYTHRSWLCVSCRNCQYKEDDGDDPFHWKCFS